MLAVRRRYQHTAGVHRGHMLASLQYWQHEWLDEMFGSCMLLALLPVSLKHKPPAMQFEYRHCSFIWLGELPYQCCAPCHIALLEHDCLAWLPAGSPAYLLQSFEALNQRAVAVVVDPVQSVKGKVVIDAFRLISPQTMMLGQEPRQTTSNLGALNKPSIQALIHGLNRHYYSIGINYRCEIDTVWCSECCISTLVQLAVAFGCGLSRDYYSIGVNYR